MNIANIHTVLKREDADDTSNFGKCPLCGETTGDGPLVADDILLVPIAFGRYALVHEQCWRDQCSPTKDWMEYPYDEQLAFGRAILAAMGLDPL